ncbi:hypothetical protein CW685_04050 [Macrococcoides caseolyticum]|uniref:hypothetical protein n=1 Tax=Macrococcoides caseolyticum TaxID=69966 RepID=UPI000C34F0EB|nr:hypothetical protein [Macrococcus caseolyticus]PKE12698.1 hypothetical protein CW685_04050 [Macrococcus caseolyticus]
MTKLIDIKLDIEELVIKIKALDHLAFNNLEEIENRLKQDWITSDFTLKRITTEQVQELYILTTIISNIRKTIETLHVDVEKIKEADNVIPDQEPTLPANKE